MNTLDAKLNMLKQILKETNGCVVAYSGGVDSSLLVRIAYEVLGDKCIAVTARSSTYPLREYESATKWIKELGAPHITIVSEELDIPGFSDNPPERCYHCKKELLTKLIDIAKKHGVNRVIDGANADDVGDYRPGMRAAAEMGVISPLKECGFTKAEIRYLAKEVYNLPMADKPSMACTASRFPYGSKITSEKLLQVESIENFLFDKGFKTLRARHHGDLLRLELGTDEMKLFDDNQIKGEFVTFAKSKGFSYITLDLEGYRTGSMNETLDLDSRELD